MKKLLKYLSLVIVLILILATILGHTKFGNYYPENQFMVNTIKVKKEFLNYYQRGAGKDILFIHGTPGTILDWKPLMHALDNEYRVTAFDRPGHGVSTDNEYYYTLEENAEATLLLIEKLKLNNPLIVGHSYGGSIATYLAANNLIDSAKYVIIDAPLYNTHIDFIYHLLNLPIIGEGIAFLANYTIASSFIEHGVSKTIETATEDELKEIIAERKRLWLQPKVLLSRAKELINLQSSLDEMIPKYASITAPITLLTGKGKYRTLAADSERFHKEVPNSKLKVYKNCAHYVQIDRFNEVLMEILGILNSPNS